MEKQEAIAAIVRRSNALRTPIYKLCQSARVAPSTFTRWQTKPESATWSTIGKLETRLAAMERHQIEMLSAVRDFIR